jgi:anti-sigma regulatory factor (Ser/Thr protein kinase)
MWVWSQQVTKTRGRAVLWSSQQVFSPTASAPGQARQFAYEQLERDLAGSVALDDSVLVVTELLTNAINAGATRIDLGLELHTDHVLLSVTDDAPGKPEVQPLAPFATHGRGLHIIEHLAQRWGTEPLSPGKRVWAELPATPRPRTPR